MNPTVMFNNKPLRRRIWPFHASCALAVELLIVVSALTACHGISLGSRRPAPAAPSRSTVVHRLRECLNNMPTGHGSPQVFISPCVGMELASLPGIARSDLIAALGAPKYCVGKSNLARATGKDCPPAYDDAVWFFYRDSLSFVASGWGPHLYCEGDELRRCRRVYWGDVNGAIGSVGNPNR
jgi:hypothetical protein